MFTRCADDDPLFRQMACIGFVVFAVNMLVLLILFWTHRSPIGVEEETMMNEEDLESNMKAQRSTDLMELAKRDEFLYHLPIHYKNLKCSSVREKRRLFLSLTQFNASVLPPIVEHSREDEEESISTTPNESEKNGCLRSRRLGDSSDVFAFVVEAFQSEKYFFPEGRTNLLDQFFLDDDEFEPSYIYPPDIDLSEEAVETDASCV